MEFFECLIKTVFANAKQSTPNSYFCLFLQYLANDLTNSQNSKDVLLRFAKVAISHRKYCVFQTTCFTSALTTIFWKLQYLWAEMLDCSWIRVTSRMIWSILTCRAWFRGPWPPLKWQYWLRGVVEIAILSITFQDAFRRHFEVFSDAFVRPFCFLDSFSADPWKCRKPPSFQTYP